VLDTGPWTWGILPENPGKNHVRALGWILRVSLVNAVASNFAGKQPDLAWIHADNGATP